MKEKIEKKRILFLTPRLPYPIIGGDKLKAYYMIKHLSTKYEVTLVSFYQGDQTKCDEYTNVIKQLGVNVFVIPLNPIKAGITVLPRLLRPIPLEVLYYTQKDYRKIVEDLLNTKKFDLVFSFFMRTAEYVKDRTDIKKILVSKNTNICFS